MTEEHYRYLQRMIKGLSELTSPLDKANKEQKENAEGTKQRILRKKEAILALALLDLEPVRGDLEELYASFTEKPGGNVPHDPVAMFRCLLLMFLQGETSFKSWVEQMKEAPELTILSGLETRPGVGTFYDFRDRLLDGPYQKPCAHIQRKSELYKGKKMCFSRRLKAEKEEVKEETQAELAEKNEGVVENLVKKVLEGESSTLPADFLNRVEKLLWKVAVVPSAEKGLLGDLKKLVASLDGSPVASRASGRGKRLCQCREQGIEDCSCARGYADPEATWGYDSHNDKYIFGFRFHLMALISTLGTTLPLHLSIDLAHVPDVVAGIYSVLRTVKLLQQYLPEAKLDKLLADLGYDATWFHILLHQMPPEPIVPIIPIRKSCKTPADLNGIARNEDGEPLCPGGKPYRRFGFYKRQDMLIYYCPAKNIGNEGRKDLSLCPYGSFCEPHSKMGPYLRIPGSENPRIAPPIPRDSDKFKKLYEQRTCAERFYSESKHHGGLKLKPYYRKDLYLIAGMGHAISSHARTWVKQRWGDKRPQTVEELLDWLKQLLDEEKQKRAA